MNNPTPCLAMTADCASTAAIPRCDVLAFWEMHLPRVYAYIRKRVGDAEVTRELLQDVYLKVHQECLRPGKIEKPLAWLFTLSRHVIADHYRKENRYTRMPETEAPNQPEEGDDSLPFSGCVQALMRGLPEKYRLPLFLSEIENIPQAQVARQLGLGLSGAKSRIQRARGMLKDLMLRCCTVKLDLRGHVQEWTPKADCDLFAQKC